MTEVPELRTERLLMRGFRYDDYERWVELLSLPEVGAGLGKPEGLTPHEAWLDLAVLSGHWMLRGYGHWALEELATGELVGRAGLYYPPDWPGMEVGWTVAREHWGKGYAPEAGRAACGWAHDRLGADHVVSLIHPGNEQSIRVAEKLGETLEGRHSTRGFELLVYGVDLPLDSGSRPAGTAVGMTRNEDEKLLSDEEAAAARDARNIGGPPPEYEDEEDRPADEAMRPLYESGEGVEEGFEVAEDDLEETASHEENRYSPEGRDFGDEESAGDADVEGGEADEYQKPD